MVVYMLVSLCVGSLCLELLQYYLSMGQSLLSVHVGGGGPARSCAVGISFGTPCACVRGEVIGPSARKSPDLEI